MNEETHAESVEPSPAEIRLEPESSGSAGTQISPPGDTGSAVVQVVHPIDEIDTDHIGAALGEHVDSRSRTAMAIAVAAYRDVQAYRTAVMDKWRAAEEAKDRYREQYFEEAKRVAVLESKGQERRRLQRFQSYALALGGLVAGSGLSVMVARSEVLNYGFPLFIAGAVVMWLGTPFAVRGD